MKNEEDDNKLHLIIGRIYQMMLPKSLAKLPYIFEIKKKI